ncbi:MAG: hypothetical protein OEZ47_13520 [Gammaproteobacteria bacterium]|nr:hypothetical protein [Gammaproteobacteria bacterium]
MKKILVILIMNVCCIQATMASDVYVGMSINKNESGMIPGEQPGIQVQQDRGSEAYGVYIGKDSEFHSSIELFYLELGNFGETLKSFSDTSTMNFRGELLGVSLAKVLYKKDEDSFYLKLGVYQWNTENYLSSNGGIFGVNSRQAYYSGIDPLAGIGLIRSLGEFSVRGEFIRYNGVASDINGSKIKVNSLSLSVSKYY